MFKNKKVLFRKKIFGHVSNRDFWIVTCASARDYTVNTVCITLGLAENGNFTNKKDMEKLTLSFLKENMSSYVG